MRSLLLAIFLGSAAAQAAPLSCKVPLLQEGLIAIKGNLEAETRMRLTASRLLSACTGFSDAQSKHLDEVAQGGTELLRGHAIQAFNELASNEKTAFCPGKPFVVLYAPAPERAKHYDRCKLAKQKFLSRDEWTAALAPEPAYMLHQALKKAKVPAALAGALARHFSGPGLYDSLWHNPMTPRDSLESERPSATCNQAGLDEGLKQLAAPHLARHHQMALTLTMIAEECVGALPREWRNAFEAVSSVHFEDRRPILVAALYDEDPSHALAKRLCGARPFPEKDSTAEKRKALYRDCGFDKQGALTLEEWTQAEAPETGVAVYDWLINQKLPREKARKLAVLAAGVGARASYEADQKEGGEP
jgi:hypothetical protein